MNEAQAEIQQQGCNLGEARARRYANWDDLSEAEKINRMREIVKRQGETVDHLARMVHDLMSHQHGGNGEVVGPLRAGYGVVAGVSQDRGRYF